MSQISTEAAIFARREAGLEAMLRKRSMFMFRQQKAGQNQSMMRGEE
jgi:hypothetical protein